MTNSEKLETYLGVKSENFSTHKCSQCGKTFNHYHSEIWYKIENKKFCSYNCKCKYKKTHEQVFFSTKKLIISHIVDAKSFDELSASLAHDLAGIYNYKGKEGLPYHGNTKGKCKKSKYEKYRF